MSQHINLISRKNVLTLLTVTFFCLSSGTVYGDSTYFPEDMEATDEAADHTTAENSEAIKEWAELPSKKDEVKKPEPIATSAPAPTAPTPVATSAPASPAPTPAVATATVTPSAKEPQPLQLTTVEPRSKPLPVKDQAAEQNTTQRIVLAYSDVANDRAPLGILEPAQEVHNQKWYIYSSAIRGLKNSSDKLQVVSMEGSAPNRGTEIKDLLVEMGVESEKIQLIHGTGAENQKGMTYLFAGK